MNKNTSLRMAGLGRRAGSRGLALLLLLAALLAGPVRADVGLGVSGLFTVDTRYGFSFGSGVSGFFSLDTRQSGWSGVGYSALFTVDTRGVTSGPAVITLPPQSLATAPGGTVTFSVTAAGASPLFYQWLYNGANIPGANSSTLTLSAVGSANAGAYAVVVWNASGSALSPPAQLVLLQPTSRQATAAEVGQSSVAPSTQLLLYSNGGFQPASGLDSSRETIVLTHGMNSSSTDWPAAMAPLIVLGSRAPTPNIVAWDWQQDAASLLVLSKIPAQGDALGQTLLAQLGPNYSQPIHFIGHSFGTLVNARAADYLHGDGPSAPAKGANAFLPANTQMTLFDEAELAPEVMNDLLTALVDDITDVPVPVNLFYGSAMPKQSRWADNYVSAVGLLHPDAANVIFTKGLPGFEPDISAWWDAEKVFHSYPYGWYDLTVPVCSAALMGNQWSFEQSGFGSAPKTGLVFLQNSGASPMDLAPTNYLPGLLLLYARLAEEAASMSVAGGESLGSYVCQVYGQVIGGIGTDLASLYLQLQTGSATSQLAPNGSPINFPKDGGGNGTNVSACAWIPLAVPSNAVSMSFTFMVQGDGQADTFAVALGGTNLLSLPLSLIQTNVTLSSGTIGVSAWAGQTVEFFAGIVGGTSTNVSLTVGAITFYAVVPPSLQAQASGSNLVITWPVSADGYALETSASLTGTNTWVAVTNVPAIVNFQNTVTNAISASSGFYRLRKPQ